MMRKILLAATIAMMCSYTLKAQFSLEGQYRPRLEIRNGFKTPILEGQEPAAFMEHRARLNAMYKEEKYGFKISLQDIRIWGETGQINKSDGLLSVHEAYGDYYMGSKSTFRIGRQEMAYDGHRFIGTLGWAAQARAFDAVRYMYKDTVGNEFHAFVSWNQTGDPESAPEPAKLTGNSYTTQAGGASTPTNRIFNLGLPKAQQFLWYKKTFSSGDISFMVNNDLLDVQEGSFRHVYPRLTVGTTPNFKFGDIKTGGQFYYTGGNASEDVSYAGYMFNLYVQAPKVTGAPLLGIDYISGDDNETDDVIEGWSPLYGTNHGWYGFMDYFYVGNPHGGDAGARSAGLMDIYLKTTFKVGKSKLLAHLHHFSSTAERTNFEGDDVQGSLGTELDLVWVKPLTDGVTLKLGYSQMLITDNMLVLKPLRDDTNTPIQVSPSDYPEQGIQSWAWFMINFTPKFLTGGDD